MTSKQDGEVVRELHVVAVTEDGRHVLLAGKRGATKGGFRLALDERLSAAVRGDLPRPGEIAPHSSELTPKEIQARLRTGESAESIALAAGVPVARVERFSGPVQGEMARMIDAARSAFLVRGRLGRSAVPLGQAVDSAIAQAPSLRPDSTDWSTRREPEGSWLVTVTWFARKRAREASWRYEPATKIVTALDPASAALAHSDSDTSAQARRRASAAAPAATPRKVAAKKAPAKKTPAKKATAKKATATKATAKKATAKKAPATKAPATKASATKASVKKAAVKTAPAKRSAPARTAATKVPVKKAAPRKAAAVKKAPARRAPAKRTAVPKSVAVPAVVRRSSPGRSRTLRVVPDPEPRKARTAAERDGVKTRATVPGWADVLLGTSPGGDR
jgi:hypothetical protein